MTLPRDGLEFPAATAPRDDVRGVKLRTLGRRTRRRLTNAIGKRRRRWRRWYFAASIIGTASLFVVCCGILQR